VTDDELDAYLETLEPSDRMVFSMLREQNAALLAELAKLSEQLALMQRAMFGRRSEKIEPMEQAVRKRNEPNETVDGSPMPEDDEARKKELRRHARKKSEPARKKKRSERSKRLPVVDRRVFVKPDQIPEGMTLEDFREVGEGEVIERIEHVPEHMVRVRYRLQTLASKDGDHIIKASPPPGVSPGCTYGPGVHAHVVVSKCGDSMPLHRLEKKLEREGCTIARSTLCAMFHRVPELLGPIYEAIFARARGDPYVHADETTFKVQAKGACTTGWVWTMLSRDAIAYAYDTSRGGKVAKRLLGGTKGSLMVDGYSGYNDVTDDQGRDRAACWGHTRRKFYDSLASAPEAKEFLDLVVELYRVEHAAADKEILGTDAHLALRQAQSRPVVEKIWAWVATHDERHPPKSLMAAALGYARNHRTQLERFLEDPNIPLDNNLAERALRIVALGRKNYLVAGHDEGAQNLAILHSIVATCRLHGVNPYEYIKDVLIRSQEPGVTLEALLPWNWAPATKLQ
jgi:transposase